MNHSISFTGNDPGDPVQRFFYSFASGASGMAVGPNGTYYVAVGSQGALLRVSPATFPTPTGYSIVPLMVGVDNPGAICGIRDGILYMLTGSGTILPWGGQTGVMAVYLGDGVSLSIMATEVLNGFDGATSCAFDAGGSGDLIVGDGDVYRLPAASFNQLPSGRDNVMTRVVNFHGCTLLADVAADTGSDTYFVSRAGTVVDNGGCCCCCSFCLSSLQAPPPPSSCSPAFSCILHPAAAVHLATLTIWLPQCALRSRPVAPPCILMACSPGAARVHPAGHQRHQRRAAALAGRRRLVGPNLGDERLDLLRRPRDCVRRRLKRPLRHSQLRRRHRGAAAGRPHTVGGHGRRRQHGSRADRAAGQAGDRRGGGLRRWQGRNILLNLRSMSAAAGRPRVRQLLGRCGSPPRPAWRLCPVTGRLLQKDPSP